LTAPIERFFQNLAVYRSLTFVTNNFSGNMTSMSFPINTFNVNVLQLNAWNFTSTLSLLRFHVNLSSNECLGITGYWYKNNFGLKFYLNDIAPLIRPFYFVDFLFSSTYIFFIFKALQTF
jgi:hypothetical protein